MNSFLIYHKTQNPLIFIKDGFNWKFFLFGWLWCLANKMWLSASAIILFDFILLLFNYHSYSLIFLISLKVLVSILLAFYINDIYGLGLKEQGYQLKCLICAHSGEEAQLRYLDKLNQEI